MAATSEQFTRLEERVNDVTKEVSELKGAYDHLATEVDVEKVRTDVEKVRTDVEKVRTDITKASLTQIRWLIGVVAVPTILGLINLIIQFTANTGATP